LDNSGGEGDKILSKKLARRLDLWSKLHGKDMVPLVWHDDHPTLYEELLFDLNVVAVTDLTPGCGTLMVECLKKGVCRAEPDFIFQG
jgi:hypothetical protein